MSWNWVQAKRGQHLFESKTAFFKSSVCSSWQRHSVKLIIFNCCPRQNPLQFLDKLLSRAHVFINLEPLLPTRISCLRLTNIICIFFAKMIMGIKLPFLNSQIKLNNYMAFGINKNMTRFLLKYFSSLKFSIVVFWIQCLKTQCN